MPRIFPAAVAALHVVLLSNLASAEDAPPPSPPPPPIAASRAPDALFPGAGKGTLAVGTGIPFLAMTELSVGVHERVAIGALAGIALSGSGAPDNVGFGLRPRVDVWDAGTYRVTVTAPTLYYPKKTSAWFLTRPSAQLERRFEDGSGLFAGLGLVMVVSQDSLTGKTPRGGALLPYGGTPSAKAGDASNGVWNTVNVGGSLALSSKTLLIGDGALVLRGISLPGQEWVGGVPFTVTLGVTTVL